jgi:hypothetical protein
MREVIFWKQKLTNSSVWDGMNTVKNYVSLPKAFLAASATINELDGDTLDVGYDVQAYRCELLNFGGKWQRPKSDLFYCQHFPMRVQKN